MTSLSEGPVTVEYENKTFEIPRSNFNDLVRRGHIFWPLKEMTPKVIDTTYVTPFAPNCAICLKVPVDHYGDYCGDCQEEINRKYKRYKWYREKIK